MPSQFPALAALLQEELDMVAVLACVARLVIHSEADTYRVVGVLIEAIATALDESMPCESRGAVAVETMRLLRDRLHDRGVI